MLSKKKKTALCAATSGARFSEKYIVYGAAITDTVVGMLRMKRLSVTCPASDILNAILTTTRSRGVLFE